MVSRRLALVAGSGGVGRTTLAANLACMYAKSGRKTLLVDLCFGWGGLNKFAFDLPTLEEILESDDDTESIISSSDYGFDLLTSVPPDFLEFENDDIKKLAWVLNRACSNYEHIIYDSPSGGHPLSLLAAGMSHQVYLFARPDSGSFSSAYCLLKALHLEGINSRIRVIFNFVESADHAASLKTRFDLASDHFLGLKIQTGGYILRSPELFDGDFCPEEISRSSQALLEHLEFPDLSPFQNETAFNSILNTFPGRLNHRR
jgi:flagellar biosynthesis protein FlhG